MVKNVCGKTSFVQVICRYLRISRETSDVEIKTAQTMKLLPKLVQSLKITKINKTYMLRSGSQKCTKCVI